MKKNEIYLVLLVLLFMSISNVKIEAQTLNLVPNPSFENFLDCPADVNCGAVYQIVDWYNIDVTPCPNGAPYVRSSPDYFNPCGQTSPPAQSQNAPNNFAGNQAGYNSTSSYAGFYTYHSSIYYPNYREYIGTTLPDVLKSNKQYILKMYLSLADNFNYATNGMGLHVGSTQTQISNNGYNNQWQCLNNLTPQLSVSSPITDKTNWVPVSTTITATGGERYITIGNFLNDNSVQIQSVGGTFMNSYYYIDQVSITPINFASPDVSVCPGSCTTLNADIGNFNITYQWSSSPAGFSSTSSTPTVCPTVATTYTVTATDANGGTATDAVVVSMLTPPDKPIISGYFNTCHGLTTYTITNYNQNFTYYYNINLGGTQVPFTLNQFDINWASYPNGGVLYVTVTDNNGCTATDSLKVFECCSFEGLPQKNDETWTTAPSDPAFVVNGILTINGNVNLSNKEMNFGPNAKILINPSYTLTLSNCTLKAVCRVMWDGIFINQSNSSLIVNNNTQIHNAKNAIVSNNCGIYQLSNNVILEANYKNIIVSTCPTSFNGSVSKTTFNGATQIMDQYPPILSTRTYSGIEINNVESIVVGNTTLADNRNVFYNMDFGIKNYYSNLEVYNNTFQNMSYGSLSYPPSSGVGIISTAGKFTPKNITVGGISNGTFNTNKFESCFWGVYADYYQNVTIQRDTFLSTNQWTSIYLYNHSNKTVKVLNNVITDGFVGINYDQCNNSTVDINSNRIINAYWGIAVRNVNPSTVQKLNIYNNRVWNNTTGNGIWVTNILGLQDSQTQIALISNNYVYMNSANLTQPSNGILVENSPYAHLQLNNVSRSGGSLINDEPSALNLIGINVQLSPNSYLCSNTLMRMGCGIRCAGSMTYSILQLNVMNSSFYGVRLDNANISWQGDYTYAWGNYWWPTSSGNFRIQGTPSVVTNWNYTGSYGQTNPYCPVPNQVIPPSYLPLQNKLTNITNCNIPVQLPLSMKYLHLMKTGIGICRIF
ncbi:MAG: hypothetical protein BWY47_02168 [Bacteroidetes bacterium ADurb.Bin302]|nr:MAG: hypothetical protein BWY47_02168 [Bacteroidetes bacterium ADurb.Bin302]